jgi:hypothetical protein
MHLSKEEVGSLSPDFVVSKWPERLPSCLQYVGGFEVLCEEFTHEAHVRAELEQVRAELEQTKLDSGEVANITRRDSTKKPWQPAKGLKFLALLFGVGLIFIFTAFLPHHSH